MSRITKSSVKALIKLRVFMNICLEITKNYEQLSSTISKFQAFFSKIRTLFERFFAMFWALFGPIFVRNRDMPKWPSILSNGKGHFGPIDRPPWRLVPNIPVGRKTAHAKRKKTLIPLPSKKRVRIPYCWICAMNDVMNNIKFISGQKSWQWGRVDPLSVFTANNKTSPSNRKFTARMEFTVYSLQNITQSS